jgi:hypothetical protein
VTGTATALEDGTFSGLTRTLDAYAVGINRRRGNGPELTSEVAFRRFAEGEGLGFQFGYNAIGETTRRTQLNVAYAPGGTSAFAMARLNATAAITRSLSQRVEYDANGWYTDDSGLQGGLRSTNWGALVAPRIQLAGGLLLALEGSSRLQSLGTALSEVGYAEHRAGSRLTLTRGGFTYAAGGSSALVSRSVKVDSSTVNRAFPRFTINGAISRGTVRFGAWSLTADLTDDRTNTLTLPRQGVLGIGFSQMPLTIPGVSMRLTGLAQRFAWFGDRPAAWALRGDLSMDVPMGFQLGWSVDRRPFEALAGAGTWSTSIRISRSGGIPIPTPFGRGRRSGYVYQDLNGNGRRDRDEPGLAGVIVKREKEVVSTDESGRFRFGEIPTGAIPTTVALDPRSIPIGWVDPGVPLDPEVAKRVKEIGVIPTANVRVEIVVDERDGGVVGKIDVTRALVTATDSLGRLWNSTVDASSRFVFPALPPGRYALGVDVDGVGDQLTLREPPPAFVVGEKRDATTLRVTLSPRRVRMFKAGSKPATAPAANSGDGKPQAPAAAPATVMPGEPMAGTPGGSPPPAAPPSPPKIP